MSGQLSVKLASQAGLPMVAVVIAAYEAGRWGELIEAVASVCAQTVPVQQIVVVVDHNRDLLARARRELADATVIPSTRCRGASGARNTGVAASRSEVVAFLDDDAVAAPGWLEALLPHFANDDVVGVGGRLDPIWDTRRPRWFPPEFGWAVGASYRGMPENAVPVRNVWSGNMAIRRQVFDMIDGFRDGFGKVRGRSCPEDTDLCLRAAAATAGATWIYEPLGVVGHRVPPHRATLRFFFSRCFSEGRGKAALALLDGAAESTSAERRYVRIVVPAAVGRGLRDAFHGDLSGICRSLTAAAGASAAAVAFAAGRSASALGVTAQGRRQPANGLHAPRRQPQVPLRAAGPGDGFSPALMMEAELAQPLPAVSFDGEHRRAWVLGRLHTEPIGACVVCLRDGGLTPDQFAALLWREFHEPVATRFAAAGLPQPAVLTADGLTVSAATWPFLRSRSEVLAAAPFISVVVCTRDRVAGLEACLRGLGRQEYPRFEIVVVDNAPRDDAVRSLVAGQQERARYRYVAEPRRGLSWARNAGIAAAAGEIIAFLDDDEEPDSHWLAGLAQGFARDPDIGCVTGLTVPAQLDTPAQELFEQFGGHSNGRGFAAALFSRHGPQNPLYPQPPFGAGANMAFRREALARIGGFDVAMGAGTPARASEDTLALTLTLLAGYRIAYEPAALMRHRHRRDLESLSRQVYGYGVGLTAFYTALLRHQPGRFPDVLKLVPAAVRYMASNQRPAGPRQLLRLEHRQRLGMLTGPAAYVRSVRTQARAAATAVPDAHGEEPQ